jgi:putative transposase
VDERFAISNDQFSIQGKRMRIPKLGWVRLRETLRFTGHIVSASISRTADHRYASITVDCPDPLLPRAENHGVVGVDLGVTTLATLSTGEATQGPKALRRLLDRVRRLPRTWWPDSRRGPLVPEQQDLFRLWPRPGRIAAGPTQLDMS